MVGSDHELSSYLNNGLLGNYDPRDQANQLAQQASWFQHQLAQQADSGPSPYVLAPAPTLPLPLVRVSALSTKAHTQIMALIEQLPMAIVAHIDNVSFYKADEKALKPHRFVVLFDNRHELELTEVNTFPSEKDLAQIALECP